MKFDIGVLYHVVQRYFTVRDGDMLISARDQHSPERTHFETPPQKRAQKQQTLSHINALTTAVPKFRSQHPDAASGKWSSVRKTE
jgi:hypothetical protein